MGLSSAGSPLDSKYSNSWDSPKVGTYRQRQSMVREPLSRSCQFHVAGSEGGEEMPASLMTQAYEPGCRAAIGCWGPALLLKKGNHQRLNPCQEAKSDMSM